jgi:hypothetical protein
VRSTRRDTEDEVADLILEGTTAVLGKEESITIIIGVISCVPSTGAGAEAEEERRNIVPRTLLTFAFHRRYLRWAALHVRAAASAVALGARVF